MGRIVVAPHRDYEDALGWMLRERGGGGGHPPRDKRIVAGWKTVQLISFLYDKPPSMVAADLIELDLWQAMAEQHPP